MNKVMNDLKREYELYSDRDLAILAKKYFNITTQLSRTALVERMVSSELNNSYK